MCSDFYIAVKKKLQPTRLSLSKTLRESATLCSSVFTRVYLQFALGPIFSVTSDESVLGLFDSASNTS